MPLDSTRRHLPVIMVHVNNCLFVVSLLLFDASLSYSDGPLRWSLYEESPENTVVGDVKTASGLHEKYSPDVLARLRFAFLSQTGTHPDFFSLSPNTGVIRTTKRIDRDTICIHTPTCVMKATVTVRHLQYFQLIQVQISIIDINDNFPTFPQDQISFKISEATIPGIIGTIPAARDKDKGQNSVQNYELLPKSSQFRLQVRGITDRDDLPITLMSPLDRETSGFHQLTVVAYDGGSPQKSGTMLINITVLDSNDNVPKFPNDSYVIKVLESAPLNTKLLTVQATDPDSGLNSKIQYSFSPNTAALFGDTFTIDKYSGSLFLKKKLDYQVRSLYKLSVKARDMGPQSVPVSASVTIHVTDINDHAPEITLHAASGGDHFQIVENAPLQSFVGHVSIIDLDGGENGRVFCSLSDTNFRLKHIRASEYKIENAAVLDREEKDRFPLVISCRDHGSPNMLSNRQLFVSVLDDNDNAPRFSRQVYNIGLAENGKVGSVVVQVKATDRDLGANAEITYSLVTRYNELLTINSKSGVITALQSFDREQIDKIEMKVIASDGGNPAQSSTAIVRITIRDVNDEKPRFSQSSYTFHVREDTPSGGEVGRILVTDADAEPFNSFRISIFNDKSSQHSQSVFQINPKEGVITTKIVLPENITLYTFSVAAEGDHKPFHQATANVTVFIVSASDKDTNALSNPQFPTENIQVIIIYALAATCGIVFVVLVVVLVLCLRGYRRRKKPIDYMSAYLAGLSSYPGGTNIMLKRHSDMYGEGRNDLDVLKTFLGSLPYTDTEDNERTLRQNNSTFGTRRKATRPVEDSTDFSMMETSRLPNRERATEVAQGRRPSKDRANEVRANRRVSRDRTNEIRAGRRPSKDRLKDEGTCGSNKRSKDNLQGSGTLDSVTKLPISDDDSNQKRQQKTRRSNSDNLSTCSADVSNTDSGGDTARSKRSQRAGKAPGRCTDTARSAGSTYESINRKRKSPGQRRHKGPKSPHSLNRGAGRPKSRQGGSRDENPESSSDKHKVALVHPQAALVIPRRNAEEMNSDEEPDFYQGGSHSGSDGALHHDSEPEQLDSDVSDDSHQAQQVPKPAPRYIYPNQRSDPQYDAATPPKGYEKLQQRLGADGLSDENVSSGSDEDHIPNLNAGSDEYLSRRNIVV